MEVVGISHHSLDDSNSLLGQEYLLTTSDHLISSELSGSSSSQTTHAASVALYGPASTLVGSSGGFEINLIWSNSVRSSANWSALEAAVIAAAKIFTHNFASADVINIKVGFGAIAGQPLAPNALGESESYGYITNYSTVENALNSADSGLVLHGLMAANALTAAHPPTNANFFISSAEAKALGLVSGSSSAIDGYIGLSSSSSLLYFSANGGAIEKNQYDAIGIAAHEISEVMGRIGQDGEALGPFNDVYTPLDLFRYDASYVRDLTPTPGYFSTTDGSGGANSLNSYNNPANGGDAADWASKVNSDSYDAFGTPGIVTHLSSTDLLEFASLGYALSWTGLVDIINRATLVA